MTSIADRSASSPSSDVHVAIAEMVRHLASAGPRDLDQVLDDLAAGAVHNIDGAEEASISIAGRKRTLVIEAATGELAEVHNKIQNSTGQGPCLSAIWEEPLVRITDLHDETRWPQYTPDARATIPYRSILSVRLHTGSEPLGSLSLYATPPHAFAPESEEIASIFAAHASAAWTAAVRGAQFEDALASRDIIAQAKGMVMERFGIDAMEAFGLLSKLSQDTNTRVIEVARKLLDAEARGITPS
ncbi:ANTAR domain-containing protein [Williamsia deligens]|uniref:ANTAR domain-containing protein n=1 Tax=Williamsia deligens TaxID=321325 RepID=A0ABW3G5H0_9NOCA|nr:GAF and ANTAR domain-containing protein [Williamsia deligens]MCP2193324.1 GAF domain-containing protein [Williamsia deligens]